uniref:Uncharacterized protein n=1 Tax=Anguilla anguilla TaxID=7936 RepID=A0A0E9TUM1_ANGAN
MKHDNLTPLPCKASLSP